MAGVSFERSFSRPQYTWALMIKRVFAAVDAARRG
jgi:hypothetical protein